MCKILQRFSEDLSGMKSLLCIAYNLPDRIPSSQWDCILRGESVNLNQVFSSMHFVQLNNERKGCMRDSKIIFAVSESKCQIWTGAEWSAAFCRLAKGVTFLFPHQDDEFKEYTECYDFELCAISSLYSRSVLGKI
jgi:hypothetical protein